MFVYYINIPLNQKGIEELENYDDKMVNVKTYELTQDEYEALRAPGGLFQKFDELFGTIIDVCEEERILNEDLTKALEICNKFIGKKLNAEEMAGINKIVESLQLAIASDAFWEIDIYLE